jgi:arylsulfatase
MATTKKKYNVLLLMTDQHRFDVLGCAGNELVDTPNIDKFASEGTVFDSAYSSCPSCIPARAKLLTGMSQWHTGILGMGQGQSPLREIYEHTLPGELAKAGYYCKCVGKMHVYPQRSLFGFHHIELDESLRRADPDFISDYERWFNDHKDGDYGMSVGRDWNGWEGKPYDNPPGLHPNIWTAQQSMQFINDRDRSKPFFLKTSFARPHSPYDAIPEYFEKYQKMDLPKAEVGDWAGIHDDPETAATPAAWHGIKSDEEIHMARAGYYGNVEHIDHEIGRLLDFMDKQGILDDTLIIFTADHGDMLGDHNMWRKTYAYESSAHIPMIVRLPKDLQKDITSRSDKPVMLCDVMPTILDVLGVDIPDSVDGMSMQLPAKQEDCEWRDYMHGEHCTCYSETEEMQYLTDGKIKYIWFPRTDREQLFDLEKDPTELQSLTDDPEYSKKLEKLRLRMVKELEPRNCGLTDGDKLVRQTKPIVSPHYARHMENNQK